MLKKIVDNFVKKIKNKETVLELLLAKKLITAYGFVPRINILFMFH